MTTLHESLAATPRAIAALLAVMLMSLSLVGCFTELTDRRCKVKDDCFPGEVCESGRCITHLSVGPGGAGGGEPTPTLEITVEARSASARDTPRSATLNSPDADGPESCPSGPGRPRCTFTATEGTRHTFCASSVNHHPCRRTFNASDIAEASERGEPLILYLERCADGAPCPDAPLHGDCPLATCLD